MLRTSLRSESRREAQIDFGIFLSSNAQDFIEEDIHIPNRA